jgi:hypothetical protein
MQTTKVGISEFGSDLAEFKTARRGAGLAPKKIDQSKFLVKIREQTLRCSVLE